MKFRSTLLAAAAVFGLATAANAAPVTGQISLTGFVEALGSTGMGAATGLDFVMGRTGGASPGVAGGLTGFGGGTGTFAALGACANLGGGCGTIQDIASFATSAPIASFLTLNTGSSTSVSFDLSSITNVTHAMDATGGSVVLTANGIIHETGFDNTAGVFTLTAQGNSITSFSATTLAAATSTPEPASLAILGGSLAALGLVRRRKA